MNVFQYSAICEKNWEMNLADLSGYKRLYTFYADFSIAEFCENYMADRNAVKKTYNNVIKYWSGNIKSITEICLVLNHKSWAFAPNGCDAQYLNCREENREYFCNLYSELYYKCRDYIYKKYGKDADAMEYYYNIMD